MKKEKKIIWVIVISVLFGIAGGIFGEIMARIYIFENAFNIPFFGEINYDRGVIGVSNLIIRDAKKVVVEQDQKVSETAQSVAASQIGIFEKKNFENLEISLGGKIENIAAIGQEKAVGLGVVITSDGWIMANYRPEELEAAFGKKGADQTGAVNEALKKYVIITKSRQVFSPDKIVIDKPGGVVFWHIPAIDLPVARFAFNKPVAGGQLLMAVNWRQRVWLVHSMGEISQIDGASTCDGYSKQLMLNQPSGNDYKNNFLYNLSGEIVGLISSGGKAESIDNYQSAVGSLLKFKIIKRPSLGLNFQDLSALITDSGSRMIGALVAKGKDGVSVVKGGAADKAGLKAGDIILSVNGVELGMENRLCEMINRFLPGDEIAIVYKRGGQSKEVKVKLGEMKY